MKSSPMRNAWARPSGRRLDGVARGRPNCEPSPSSRRNAACPPGVVMIRISRMPGDHQGRQRVVDHRLVVHRQQLLAHRPGDRPQPGPVPPARTMPRMAASLPAGPVPPRPGEPGRRPARTVRSRRASGAGGAPGPEPPVTGHGHVHAPGPDPGGGPSPAGDRARDHLRGAGRRGHRRAVSGSLALLADAGHMLTDAAGLLIALSPPRWPPGRPPPGAPGATGGPRSSRPPCRLPSCSRSVSSCSSRASAGCSTRRRWPAPRCWSSA